MDLILFLSVKIALVHHARLPVTTYGGTERVVVWLARGLGALGHDVTVVCARGSRLPDVHLIERTITELTSRDLDVDHVLPIDIDLIHYHMPVHRPPPGSIPKNSIVACGWRYLYRACTSSG